MKREKEHYVAPTIEVIPMEVEGNCCIIASGGGGIGDIGNGGNIGGTNSAPLGRRSYNSASGSELEDMINDILTIEQ